MSAAVVCLASCSGEVSTLDAAGPSATRFGGLTLTLLIGSVVILTGVMALALYAFKPNRRDVAIDDGRFLAGFGLAFPFVVLLGLLIYALLLSDAWVGRDRSPDMTIEAIASQDGWTFRYPDTPDVPPSPDVLHLPANTRVAFEVTSVDVIHSFWVPRLGGKIDAIPGRVNHIMLEADAPGRMGGLCAEFCGVGHTTMTFEVIVHDRNAFEEVLTAMVEDRSR